MLPRPAPSPQPSPSEPELPEIGVEYYTVTINKTGNGNGIVKSEPGGIFCGEKCSHEFPEGTTLTFRVEPDSKSKFIEWGGDCSDCGQNTVCSIFIDYHKTCEAVFALNEKPKIVDFSVYPSSGYAPLYTLITWIVEDVENDPITCKLDVNGDGNIDYTIRNCGYQSFKEHTFSTPGTYEVTLYVEDAVQNESIKKFKVEVYQPTPPPQDEGGNGGCNAISEGVIGAFLLSILGIKIVSKIFRVFNGK